MEALVSRQSAMSPEEWSSRLTAFKCLYPAGAERPPSNDDVDKCERREAYAAKRAAAKKAMGSAPTFESHIAFECQFPSDAVVPPDPDEVSKCITRRNEAASRPREPTPAERKLANLRACISGQEVCSAAGLCGDLRYMKLDDVRAILGRPDTTQGIAGQYFSYYTFQINDLGKTRRVQLQLVGAARVDSCNYY
jgi:hypothetical protein